LKEPENSISQLINGIYQMLEVYEGFLHEQMLLDKIYQILTLEKLIQRNFVDLDFGIYNYQIDFQKNINQKFVKLMIEIKKIKFFIKKT
jgi:hypothetical protein